jgi:hypothetical protein
MIGGPHIRYLEGLVRQKSSMLQSSLTLRGVHGMKQRLIVFLRLTMRRL